MVHIEKSNPFLHINEFKFSRIRSRIRPSDSSTYAKHHIFLSHHITSSKIRCNSCLISCFRRSVIIQETQIHFRYQELQFALCKEIHRLCLCNRHFDSTNIRIFIFGNIMTTRNSSYIVLCSCSLAHAISNTRIISRLQIGNKRISGAVITRIRCTSCIPRITVIFILSKRIKLYISCKKITGLYQSFHFLCICGNINISINKTQIHTQT